MADREPIEAALDTLVEQAVRPLDYPSARRQAVRALVDARVWQSLADHGLDAEAVEQALRRLVLAI